MTNPNPVAPKTKPAEEETFWCKHCGKQIYLVPKEIAESLRRGKPLYAATPAYWGEDAPIACRHANFHAPLEPPNACT